MKLRLPLCLIYALTLGALPYTAHAGAISGEIKTDTNYPDISWITNSNTLTIGDGTLAPVVTFADGFVMEGNSTVDIKSGKVNLTKDSVSQDYWNYTFSLWLGKSGEDKNTLNILGGEITGKSVLLGNNNTTEGLKYKAIINIHAGTAKFSGIYNAVKNNLGENNPSELNLLGGTLLLGAQGLWAVHDISTDIPSAFHVNLYKGTIGSYESWSSGDKTWTPNKATGEWTLASDNIGTNRLVWQLDYAGAALPDGTVSDGTGSLKIAPAEGTTITVSSLIKGTGTGDFIKTGKGTLFVNSADNTFTQNIVLSGGALVIKKNGALGDTQTKTITVKKVAEEAAEEASFDMTDPTWSLRYTDYAFIVKEGSKLRFPKGSNPFGFTKKLTFESGSTVIFEDKVLMDEGGMENEAIERILVEKDASLSIKDTLSLTKATQVTLSGTMTAELQAGTDGAIPVGLSIGDYQGSNWNDSKFIIMEGGLLKMTQSKINLGNGKESGQFTINKGGQAIVWGIIDGGESGKIHLAGGTLKLGKGGIALQDVSGWGAEKSGDDSLSDVYFSAGTLLIEEDSAYTYTGAREFDDAQGTRPISSYTGHFFFGKDDTGAIDADSTRTIDVSETATFTLGDVVLGDGGFNKTGKGTVILSAANKYKGTTVVEAGSLYLGHNESLGSSEAKLTLLGGTTLASNDKAISFSQAVLMGGADTEAPAQGETIHLGTTDKKGTLTMNGAVTLNASVNTLDVVTDVTFGGTVESLAGKLIKNGSGTLTFANSGTAINEIEIKSGTVDFDSAESLVGVNQLKVSAGKLDLSASTATTAIHFTGAGTLAGASAYAGTLQLGDTAGVGISTPWFVSAEGNTKAGSILLNNQNVRMNVNGSFSTESITFILGYNNASLSDNANPLITANSAEITGTEKGSFVLNFDPLYIRNYIEQGGGAFQLFSTGVTYAYDAIKNNHRQEISLDEKLLTDTGRLVWTKIKLDSSLIDQSVADSFSQNDSYTPKNGFIYLGAMEGQTISVASDVEYVLDAEEEIFTYKFTPGKGNMIYKGLLTGAEHKLDIIDYAGITEKAEDHSEGYVALSNNANDFGLNTNITGTTAIVDLSLDKDQNLTGSNGNLNVNVLGTGDVTLVSSTVSQKGSTLCLRSYGNEKLQGISTYTYANDFIVSEGSTLLQSGSNDQILTGTILSRAGDNTIANDGTNSFILKGNINHEGAGVLTLRNEQAGGNIVLDGSAGAKESPTTLETEKLNISGVGTVRVLKGYNVKATEITLTDGTLSLDQDGSLTAGQKGIKGAGTLHLNGGTLKSAASWESDASISLGISSNTISTGGANVRLNKGVTGEGGFAKEGSGNLYLYNHAGGNAKGVFTVKQGRLILLDTPQEKGRSAAEAPSGEYILNGDLVLESGKGASLEGMIDANNHNVTFGDKTNFYLSVSESEGLTGYIRNAGTITIGTGTRLNVDVLDDSWITGKDYTIFSANDSIQGGNNLELTLESEFQFVDVSLTHPNDKEIGLILGKKGSGEGGQASDGTNKGEINAVVAPLVSDVLNDSSKLTGKLLKTIQTVSKMTTTEYQTYLGDMGSSASSFYTALSAQVQDATLHLNSVRNRVELMNPVLYDDWADGGIYNMWVGGINHYRDVKSGEEAPGYKMTSWGGELGCAVPMSEHFLIGVGFSYTSTEVSVKDNWGTNENDTYNVDLFARYRKDQWTLTAVLTGGFSNVDFHRNQLVKDELTRSNSSSDGNQFMGTFEAMYDVYLNEEKSWILQPLVNLTAGRAKLDGLSETGELKNAGLMIGSQSFNMFSAGVGAKIAYEYQTEASDLPGRVELKAMYVNDMGDVDFKVNGRFIGAPENSFNLNGVSNERSAVVVAAGWVAPISTYGQFFADASCEFRKDQNGVSSTVGFSFQF